MDLRTLFPDASAGQVERIQRATERVKPAAWSWFEKHAAPAPIPGPGLHCVLIGTVELGEDDTVELELCVGRRADTAGVVVSATLGVWCWCQQNHNVHYIRDVETTASTAEELTAAIESAVDQIVQWREASPHDAEQLRAEAGLPLRAG